MICVNGLRSSVSKRMSARAVASFRAAKRQQDCYVPGLNVCVVVESNSGWGHASLISHERRTVGSQNSTLARADFRLEHTRLFLLSVVLRAPKPDRMENGPRY